ncbi:hypothetical protein [Streptomyces sp. NPDC048111]|uniref:hypothetical protein n=1 Tax=Streptomyces sp. NPDC048111 TaxID=3365500 RepID=UPI003722E9C1
MSTTRHLVNRRRRLAHAGTTRVITRTPSDQESRTVNSTDPKESSPPDTGLRPPGESAAERHGPADPDAPRLDPADPDTARRDPAAPANPAAPADPAAKRRSVLAPLARRFAGLRRLLTVRTPVALCVLVVLLGGFAAYAANRADALRSDPAAENSALVDPARTSEVKGQTEKAVAALFSYNYADSAPADKAASTLLTGKAVTQHHDMLAAVRAQAKDQKLVLTTTVTESGVELIDGSRARVLVYADQSSTRTAGKKPETTYAAAMFAVDVARTAGGTWQISAIDTFGQGS